jgi:carboxymethylenebutenolidase
MDGKNEDRDEMPRIARRSFVTGTLASGFALAVQPISAETIITDTVGLTAGMVTLATSDGSIPAYRAHPAASPKAPTILVVQEIFGLHEHIKDICRRLAKLGYYAIAPDLYARFGDATKVADIASIMKEIVPKVADARVLADLDTAAAFAKSEGALPQLAITGFCWGGRIVWLYTAHNPDLKAAVAWYGPLRTMGPLAPQSPLDIVADLKAPVLGLYGGADQSIPIDSIRKVEAAAKAAGKKVEFVVYPDTPHAFNADYRPSYREGPAKDGWKRMQEWFKTNGV